MLIFNFRDTALSDDKLTSGTGVATTLKIVQWPTQCGLPALWLANSDKSIEHTGASLDLFIFYYLSLWDLYDDSLMVAVAWHCHQTTSTPLDQVRLCLSRTTRVMGLVGKPENKCHFTYILIVKSTSIYIFIYNISQIDQFINTVEDDTKSTLNRGALSLTIPTRPHKGFSVLHSSRQSETSRVQSSPGVHWSVMIFLFLSYSQYESLSNYVHSCFWTTEK